MYLKDEKYVIAWRLRRVYIKVEKKVWKQIKQEKRNEWNKSEITVNGNL